MGSEVDYDADIAHTRGERAKPTGMHLEDAAQLVILEALIKFDDGRIVAFDMADCEKHLGCASGRDHLFGLGDGGGNRLFDEDMHASVQHV
jgi:hypothetical protein